MAWGPVGSRLEAAGADVGFLGWLKGSEDRLPREGLLGRVVPEDFARAIRAVSWLAGLRFRPELVPPQRAGAWGERYSVQSAFLCGALKYSTVAHRNERHGDLEALERVNETLLPESSTAEVAKDIRRLRKLGEPRRPDGAKGSRRSGGAPEGEETRRMRAAIEYLRSMKIRAPYATLAELWTEIEVQKHGESGKEYEADSIRSRLRKGDRDLDGEGATLLESWWDIYHSGDLRIVFPGKFPLSRELRELENRAATLSPKKQVLVETSSRWPRRSSRLAVLPPKDQ